jgi:4-hydroxy-2-oxoheptanedioate aldolase
MQITTNDFKRRLLAGEPQIGLWVGLVDPVAAEICAGAGFDWLLIDGEHAPNDLRSVLVQLQVIGAYPTTALFRPVVGDVHLLKQYCDIGVQTFLIPMVDTAEQAARMVAAVRYPPRGVRGVGTGLARAARWNRVEGYFADADDQMCMLVQIESTRGLQNLEAIATTDGVDGVFIGPSDLAASMGLLGQADHPSVRAAVAAAIAQIVANGKAAGVLASAPAAVSAYLAAGATFVGVGSDTVLLANATQQAAASFRALANGQTSPSS